MPNILVKIPSGSFPGQARAALVQQINDAAAATEQIPAEARKRLLCWVLIKEVEHGAWTCGGVDLTAQMLLCIAVIHVPGGVLDEAARHAYVQLMHAAFADALPPSRLERSERRTYVANAPPKTTYIFEKTPWQISRRPSRSSAPCASSASRRWRAHPS